MAVRMELSRIVITETHDPQLIELREVDGERRFHIVIGFYEAMAIKRRLSQEPAPRPQTHELLAQTIEAMGGRLSRIVINDLRDQTFFATLVIEMDGREVEVDSRPSDAIALGIANDVPVYVEEKVLDEAGS